VKIDISIGHSFSDAALAAAFLSDMTPLVAKYQQLEVPEKADALPAPAPSKGEYDKARDAATDANVPLADQLPEIKRAKRGRPSAEDKAAAAPATAADPFTSTSAALITMDTIRALGGPFMRLSNARDRLSSLLMKFKVGAMSDLKPEQFADVHAALQAEIAAG
jgi:hypothetical protein